MRIDRYLFTPVLAVSLALFALWYSQVSSPPPESSMEQVRQEAQRGGYRLIDTDTLRNRYRNENDDMLLVDTRQTWEFGTGHIAGAVNFSMEPTWWARWRARGPLKQLLGDDKDRSVVFY